MVSRQNRDGIAMTGEEPQPMTGRSMLRPYTEEDGEEEERNEDE